MVIHWISKTIFIVSASFCIYYFSISIWCCVRFSFDLICNHFGSRAHFGRFSFVSLRDSPAPVPDLAECAAPRKNDGDDHDADGPHAAARERDPRPGHSFLLLLFILFFVRLFILFVFFRFCLSCCVVWKICLFCICSFLGAGPQALCTSQIGCRRSASVADVSAKRSAQLQEAAAGSATRVVAAKVVPSSATASTWPVPMPALQQPAVWVSKKTFDIN